MNDKINYGIRQNSHYQGAGHGPVLYVADSEDEADRMENEVSTCSFCHPGRTQNYSTGTCYEVVRTAKPVGYQHEECPDYIVEAATGLAV